MELVQRANTHKKWLVLVENELKTTVYSQQGVQACNTLEIKFGVF